MSKPAIRNTSRPPRRAGWRTLAVWMGGLALAVAQPAKAQAPQPPKPAQAPQAAGGQVAQAAAQPARKSLAQRARPRMAAKPTQKRRAAQQRRPQVAAASPAAAALAASLPAGVSLEATAVPGGTDAAPGGTPSVVLRQPAARTPALFSFVDGSGQVYWADEALDGRYQTLLSTDSPERWRVPGQPPSRTLDWMESAPQVRALQPLLEAAQAATGVDADLLKAIIMVESRFTAQVVSRDGATGLMQISPRTADVYALPAERAVAPARQRLKIPEYNVMTGARMLADLFKRLGSVDVALAAWNAGEGRIRRAGGQVPEHTGIRNHIRKVLEIYWGLLQRRHQVQAGTRSAPSAKAAVLPAPGADAPLAATPLAPHSSGLMPAAAVAAGTAASAPLLRPSEDTHDR